MKLFTTKAYRRGLAMTEYLIILGIVAIACILFVSVFGKQLKNAFNRDIQALNGTKPQAVETAGVASTTTHAGTSDNMANYAVDAEKKQ